MKKLRHCKHESVEKTVLAFVRQARSVNIPLSGSIGTLFRDYMMELDAGFTKQKRKVLFFVDNCPAHPKTVIGELKSINLVFLPPNITSKAQPMDAGVIKNLKVHYRTKVVHQLIDELDSDLPVTPLT